MKQEEFIERLSQLAEIKVSKIPTQSGQQTNRLEPVIIEREGQTIEIDTKNNPTWGVVVKKLKPIIKPCEDCGLMVKDRRVNRSLYSFPINHWRTNCSSCMKTQDPETKKFTITTSQAPAYFISFIKKQDK